MSRFDLSGRFDLGAESFTWSVRLYAGEFTSHTNFRGLLARVCLVEGKSRELVIEFDPADYPVKRAVSGAQLEARIKEYTQKAIDEGWKPDSRGKPYWIAAEKRSGDRG